jgi:hypothetical protein
MNDADKVFVATILNDDSLHALLSLPEEETGVTDEARTLLATDPRHGTIRTYTMRSSNETLAMQGTFLDVWREYEDSDFGALYVSRPTGNMLVHRKPSSRIGFTPFAKENLLYASGHVRDTKRRVYVMGGKDADGKRVRRELRVTVLIAWLSYAAEPELTHLWVKWKDGKRYLVHRKGL